MVSPFWAGLGVVTTRSIAPTPGPIKAIVRGGCAWGIFLLETGTSPLPDGRTTEAPRRTGQGPGARSSSLLLLARGPFELSCPWCRLRARRDDNERLLARACRSGGGARVHVPDRSFCG
jgi:hypothetical protein